MKPVRQLTYYTGTYNETDLWNCLCLRFCLARLLQERLNIPSDWCGISTVYKQKKVIRCSTHNPGYCKFLPRTHLYPPLWNKCKWQCHYSMRWNVRRWIGKCL